jgi:hypothetical protein
MRYAFVWPLLGLLPLCACLGRRVAAPTPVRLQVRATQGSCVGESCLAGVPRARGCGVASHPPPRGGGACRACAWPLCPRSTWPPRLVPVARRASELRPPPRALCKLAAGGLLGQERLAPSQLRSAAGTAAIGARGGGGGGGRRGWWCKRAGPQPPTSSRGVGLAPCTGRALHDRPTPGARPHHPVGAAWARGGVPQELAASEPRTRTDAPSPPLTPPVQAWRGARAWPLPLRPPRSRRCCRPRSSPCWPQVRRGPLVSLWGRPLALLATGAPRGP